MATRKFDSSLFWDIKRPMSYNCLFNFIIGMRGAGKTYTSLKEYAGRAIKMMASGKEPRKFMYVRRYEEELKDLTINPRGRLFAKVQREFPENVLEAKSNLLICDGEIIGYAQPLSKASKLKSDNLPGVDALIFDEFIIDDSGTHHYLRDEVRMFLDLYETISRGEVDVVCWFLSNAVSVANPYFDYFHLDKPYNGDIQRFGQSREILVQNVVNKELAEAKKATRFGQIIADSEYTDYAYNNDWLLDNTDFIEKKTQRCEYYVTLFYKDFPIGVWYDPKQWRYYISDSADLKYPRAYSVTTDDHKPNVMLLKAGKKEGYIKQLITAYQLGAVRYENLKVKSWFRDIMRMVNS